jgi:murein hydrolase activator
MVITFILTLFLNSTIYAKPTASESLKTIQTEIKKIKSSIKNDRSSRKAIKHQIQASNNVINTLGGQIKKTNKSILTLTNELSELSSKCKKNTSIRNEETKYIYKTFHAVYKQLKPNIQIRNKYPWSIGDEELDTVYIKHIINHQQQKLKTIKAAQEKIVQYKAAFLSKRQQMMDMTSRKNIQKLKMKHEKKHKSTLIKTIDSKILSNDMNLKKLIKNKKKLEDIIKKQTPFNTNQYYNIVKIRNKLSWPSSGKILHRYGEKIQHSEFKYDALHMKLSSDHIYSVSDGVVVFNDYLEGYGKLVVIDHGHGAMSLYGHCLNIIVKRGDKIKPHQIIANSRNNQAFYFGIRIHGTAQNPFLWLNKSANMR